MAEKLSDKSFFRRLNTTGLAANTVANYDICHNICWLQAKKESQRKSKPKEKFTKNFVGY